jgi:flagellar basal body-associated protein FliL
MYQKNKTMSKRVLIILLIGLALIVGAFFLHKWEVTPEEEEPEVKKEPKLKVVKSAEVKTEPVKTDKPGDDEQSS